MSRGLELLIAQTILQGFDAQYGRFLEVTSGAQQRFEQADWHAVQQAMKSRIHLYDHHVGLVVEQLRCITDGKSTDADFLLRVSGMSMKDIGILDGDLLAVHKTQDVRNGQVVVARIDEEVTVKRLKKQGNVVELLPENSEFSPIVVDLREQSFTIEGLAVGVIRNGNWQ